MEAASEVLVRRGSIASRLTAGGLRVYSVRYVEPGGARQRAIYLGENGELVRRAQGLIDAFREDEKQAREVEAVARFATASVASLRRLAASRRGGPDVVGGHERG